MYFHTPRAKLRLEDGQTSGNVVVNDAVVYSILQCLDLIIDRYIFLGMGRKSTPVVLYV